LFGHGISPSTLLISQISFLHTGRTNLPPAYWAFFRLWRCRT
jgi:hypothetical protein